MNVLRRYAGEVHHLVGKRWMCWSVVMILLLTSCAERNEEQFQKAKAYNDRAYALRYVDIDSSLYYAEEAYKSAVQAPSLQVQALNHKAFVLYQQMYYDKAQELLDVIAKASSNQIEMLCADVLAMKIAQRVGEGKKFYDKRWSAERRIKRITEEESSLPDIAKKRFEYALSEYHIVSATYYYYLGLDTLAQDEMDKVAAMMTASSDTAQWLYYHYMLGSGGMIRGIKQDVVTKEFDHLMRTFSLARKHHFLYFSANALQSLSVMLEDSAQMAILQKERENELNYLLALPESQSENHEVGEALALAAFNQFETYKDLFQSACALRTLGELAFQRKEYEEALEYYQQALDYVERQHGRSSQQLPQWMASIRQQLSLAYSARGNTQEAMANRQAYEQLLNNTSQNSELQSRREHLEEELRVTRMWLYALISVMVLCLVVGCYFLHRIKSHVRKQDDFVDRLTQSEIYLQAKQKQEDELTVLEDEKEEKEEALAKSLLQTDKWREGNVERRAKVQMVYAIVPYLDRVIAAAQRLRPQAPANKQNLEYIRQLINEIQIIQGHLTDWIQMTAGAVKLHVSTVPLQEVFDIVSQGGQSFRRKGVELIVETTDLKVKADKALVLFMVNTLADNARKFTPEGGVVRISAKEEDECVEVSISDTGIGLSAEEVQILNESKVYDPSKIGTPDKEKGFGFGIMNCKGIIGKMRKSSSMFACCDFGCKSQKGGGTTFWFKLPQVVVAVLLCFSPAIAVKAEPMDTLQLLRNLSDSAFSAQERKDWYAYDSYNEEYVRLHHQYTADSSLPVYCARMQQLQADSVVLYVLLFSSSILLIGLFYVVLIRPRLNDRKAYLHLKDYIHHLLLFGVKEQFDLQCPYVKRWEQHPTWMTAKTLVEEMCALHIQKIGMAKGDIESITEEFNKSRFQEERLYVSNQVLDNCLSTIKHETMYYPARVMQVVNQMEDTIDEDAINELNELLQYYRHIYLLLFEQAAREVKEHNFQLRDENLQDVLSFKDMDSSRIMPCKVRCDKRQIRLMLQTLIKNHAQKGGIRIDTACADGFATVTLSFLGESLPAENVFSESVGQTPFLIAKEVIREHDAHCGMPGLRLWAENCPEGYKVLFTLFLK